MSNKKINVLCISAILISVVAIMLVFFRVEPIEVNFFGGLVAVLSLLVIVITWFQISKSITEENRIRNMIKDQIELSTYKMFQQLSDADKGIIDNINKLIGVNDINISCINENTCLLLNLIVTFECEYLKSIMRSGDVEVDFSMILTTSMNIIVLSNHIISNSNEKSNDDYLDFIFNFLDELKDFTSMLSPRNPIPEEYAEKINSVMSNFKNNLKKMKYLNSDELISNIQSLLRVTKI